MSRTQCGFFSSIRAIEHSKSERSFENGTLKKCGTLSNPPMLLRSDIARID
jgi:hypothetical protein